MKFIEKCQYMIALAAAACSGSVTAGKVSDVISGTPTGPYTSTCTNITWSESTRTLTATCKANGWAVQSSLYLPLVVAPDSIINCNGFLSEGEKSCTFVETIVLIPSDRTPDMPKGPYEDVCVRRKWDSKARILSAACPTTAFNWGDITVFKHSTLSLPLQTGQTDPIYDVNNCSGNLKWLPNNKTC